MSRTDPQNLETREMYLYEEISLLLIGLASLTIANAAQAGVWHIKQAWIGTVDKDTLSQVYNMIQNDREALAQLVLNGDAYMFNVGDTVFAVKNADFFTNWQVRPKGSTRVSWISVENVDSN
jgi:hypothetical protein